MQRLLFTCGLLAALGLSATAQADRVVLLTPSGTAEEEKLHAVEEALADAIVAVGHEALTEAGALDVTRAAPPPETANEMRGVAEMQGAQYVVVPRVTALPGQYRLYLRVGYAATPRVEEIEVNVLESEEAERLRDVMGAMLRPEGLGEDAVRLTAPVDGPDAQPDEASAEDEAERLRREEEERARAEEEASARQEFLERERERAEEERQRAEERWEARERYGERAPWMFQVGVDLRAIIAHRAVIVDGQDRGGGALGGLSLRLGRAIPQVPGLEARAAFDMTTGAASGFALAAGAVYLYSPFEDVPVFVGAGAEAGWFQFVTGTRAASFLVRGGPVAAWRPTDELYLEAALPELMLLTANGGVGTLGLSIRGGIRF